MVMLADRVRDGSPACFCTSTVTAVQKTHHCCHQVMECAKSQRRPTVSCPSVRSVVARMFARGGLKAQDTHDAKVLHDGPQAVSKDRKDETLRRQQEGQRDMLRMRASAASDTPLQEVIERIRQWGTGDAQPGRRD